MRITVRGSRHGIKRGLLCKVYEVLAIRRDSGIIYQGQSLWLVGPFVAHRACDVEVAHRFGGETRLVLLSALGRCIGVESADANLMGLQSRKFMEEQDA